MAHQITIQLDCGPDFYQFNTFTSSFQAEREELAQSLRAGFDAEKKDLLQQHLQETGEMREVDSSLFFIIVF